MLVSGFLFSPYVNYKKLVILSSLTYLINRTDGQNSYTSDCYFYRSPISVL